MVAWRYRKGGGGHQFFTGTTRESSPPLPTIARGWDIQALTTAMMPIALEALKDLQAGRPAKELNKDEINAELAGVLGHKFQRLASLGVADPAALRALLG